MFDWSGIRNKHNGLVPFVSQWIKQKKLLKKSQSTRQLAYTRVTVSSKRRIKLIKHRRSSLIKQWNNALLWQTTYYQYTKFPNLKNLEIKKHVSPYPTTFIQRSNKYTSNLSFFQRKKTHCDCTTVSFRSFSFKYEYYKYLLKHQITP